MRSVDKAFRVKGDVSGGVIFVMSWKKPFSSWARNRNQNSVSFLLCSFSGVDLVHVCDSLVNSAIASKVSEPPPFS